MDRTDDGSDIGEDETERITEEAEEDKAETEVEDESENESEFEDEDGEAYISAVKPVRVEKRRPAAEKKRALDLRREIE
jgi:hypothetical protein